MRTAADMLAREKDNSSAGDGSSDGNASFEDFQQGMMVEHPEYGKGKIVALSGSGRKRSATVRFFTEQRDHNFRLAQCPLKPVGSRGADAT